MKLKYLQFIFFLGFGVSPAWATQHTVTNSGLDFTPDNLVVQVGDTVNFVIGSSHNVVEVSKETFDARGTNSNGGFSLPFGGGSVVITEAKTYYYVCQPHVTLDMVGTIVATAAPTNAEAFVAHLSGSQEALPVLSGASGMVNLTLTDSLLTVDGSFDGLNGDFDAEIAGGAHIHLGYAGQNGGIEVRLNTTINEDLRGGVFEADSNAFVLTAAQLEQIKRRQFYINIHTKAFPSGELRGQILPTADNYYSTNLFGSNEVPSVISKGAGAMVFEVTGDSLFVSGSFSNLQGAVDTNILGGLHLHAGLAGENGGVELPLTIELDAAGTSGIITGGYEISAAQKDLLANRMGYINLHTQAVGSGELRGQVHGIADAVFRTHLSGSNETNPVTSAATGELLFELVGDSLFASGVFKGLSSDLNSAILGGAHIHLGIAGQNGGVEFPLVVSQGMDATAGVFSFNDNRFSLTSDQITALKERRYYVNIHSLNHASGEIRGQIVPESQFFMTGFLTGMQEKDPVLSGGQGNVQVEVLGNQLVLTGSFNQMDGALNTSIAGGSHLHLGLAGENGPVQFPLIASTEEDLRTGSYQAMENVFELTDGLLDTLIARGFYVNIHSTVVASGELRAQVVPEATAYFYAPVSGANEPTPVPTTGNGGLIIEWDSGKIAVSGSFDALQSDLNTEIAGGAHLHVGLPGQNGGILFVLNSTIGADNKSGAFEVANNQFEVTEAFPDTIINRMVYLNIHSIDVPSGEIRGQLLPYANNYFIANSSGINEVEPVTSPGAGTFSFTQNGSEFTVAGSFSGLAGEFNEEIGGGAHIHMGFTGINGGVVIPINVELDADRTGGVFKIENNSFSLDSAQIVGLKSGAWYVNIHSTTVPPGEIRGQILPEANQFPEVSTITGPASGAALTIEGGGFNVFEATWSEANDADGDTISYVWQLSVDAGFDAPIFAINRGDTTNFTTDFTTVDALLSSAGVQVDQSVTLYHRVLVTDGSLFTASPIDSVLLTRGVVSNIQDFNFGVNSISVYPNPVLQNQTQVVIEAERSQEVKMIMVNSLGQVVKERLMDLTVGVNQYQIDLLELPTGNYFMQVFSNAKLLGYKQISIQR